MKKMSRRTTTTTLALVASGALLAGGAIAAGSSSPLLDRTTKGDITEFGGAQRLDGDQTDTIRAATIDPGAKNVILIIGDGMGDSEITVARNYLKGAAGFFEGIDALPMTGQMLHWSVNRDGSPNYVPDSAATGTAWATGTKTYNNGVGIDKDGNPQQTILQWAKETGRATGNVATSDIQDATPAVLVSHISNRGCFGPVATSERCPEAALENGGLGSITEQMLDTRPDLSLGGGRNTFSEVARAGEWEGLTLEEQAKQRGFQYVTTEAELEALTEANQDAPVMGLFSGRNMPVKFQEFYATPDGASLAPHTCQVNAAWEEVPSLDAMTRKSIELLAGSEHGQENGFFLQVESASIDKRDHAADACGQIGETDQLDEAVTAALEFAQQDGNTMVIVTADHAHTSMIVGGRTPGLDARLLTEDGRPMLVTYGTAPQGGSQQHTGAQVRVAGYGPGAANVVGLIDQTDLFFTMRDGMSTWDEANGGGDTVVTVADVRQAFDAAVAERTIAGPIVNRLTAALEQAHRHAEAGRTKQAVDALDRFLSHLGSPNRPDTVDQATAAQLRELVEAAKANLNG
ncbi:alkaline phosphatase [Ornithinimicrobium sp. Y1694]|uniref:alkaline phosphatase n=1 Tax=Ornithinimicrobium sp. Y1694 TaxID=3418590 RepID=UPI003CF7A3E2